jgi:hypothetical protein
MLAKIIVKKIRSLLHNLCVFEQFTTVILIVWWMGIEKKSLSIVRLIVFPNHLGRTTRETFELHSMSSVIRDVLSRKVHPPFTILPKLSQPMGTPFPAKRVAVPSNMIEKRLDSAMKIKE